MNCMSEKFENVLNLALETPREERLQTEDLDVGFDDRTGRWELIVKYNGSLEALLEAGIGVEYLIAGYALLDVPEELVSLVDSFPGIEYVEKPKQYFYADPGPADRNACITGITAREPFLRGKDVLIAVLDSGIDYRNPVFLDSEGRTRILALWDQSIQTEDAPPPEGFQTGAEYTSERIDAALQAASEAEGYAIVPSRDVSGHGTAVAGIAAGCAPGVYRGVATEAKLLIVKLGTTGRGGFPGTTQIMRGVTYALGIASKYQMPLVINLSFGNTYGPHNGTSLMERFLDNAAEIGRTVICVGSGNEGDNGGHVSGNVLQRNAVELAVANYENSLSVQLWKSFQDNYRVRIRNPSGTSIVLNPEVEQGKYTLQLGRTRLLVYFGDPTPYSVLQELYVEMIPLDTYLESGVWEFRMEPGRIVTGEYALYLPSGAVRNSGTSFLQPTSDATMTIPSTSQRVITVGAYDPVFDAYASFSGRGFETGRSLAVDANRQKPDLVADGVDVLAPSVTGGFVQVTGTSFSAPIVSGSAALLMEWGIVRGNDVFLYGEKMKAFLRRGALPLRGEERYPNEKTGFGRLCPAAGLFGFGPV